jgi:hypothetical protein
LRCCGGSRDGFLAKDFHGRCDGPANTLLLIMDTEGNIFGGFTPVEWETWHKLRADPSLKSFLFPLNNPHNIPARKCAVKAEKKDQALYCARSYGPSFGSGCDLAVRDNSNSSSTLFGHTCANDVGLDDKTFVPGSHNFTVKEIEVFKIADETALPNPAATHLAQIPCARLIPAPLKLRGNRSG